METATTHDDITTGVVAPPPSPPLLVVIWANCQGAPLRDAIVQWAPPHSCVVRHFVNWKLMQAQAPLPDEFSSCHVFIYQNYGPKPGTRYDLEEFIVPHVLPLHARRISIPYMAFHGYWGVHATVPDAAPTTFSFVPLYEPVLAALRACASLRCSADDDAGSKLVIGGHVARAVDALHAPDLLPPEAWQAAVDNCVAWLRAKEAGCSVNGVADYVATHFARRRLFHHFKHPAGGPLAIITHGVLTQLASALGAGEPPPPVHVLETALESAMDYDVRPPILPAAAAALHLEFDTSGGSNKKAGGGMLSSREWYTRALTDLCTALAHGRSVGIAL